MAEMDHSAARAGSAFVGGRAKAREAISVEEALSLLEDDQLAGAKGRPFGRRRLAAGTKALLWGLRVYTVLMYLVVVWAALQSLR